VGRKNNVGSIKIIFFFNFADTEETEDDCLLTYWRMFNNLGFSGDVPFTNGLTYDDF